MPPIVLRGPGGERTVKARDFYQGAYATALEPGEILTAIRIPVPPAGHGWAYEKLKRKIGDYATAAAAVVLTCRGGKVAELPPSALTNVGRHAVAAPTTPATALVGTRLEPATPTPRSRRREAITAPAADAPRLGRIPHPVGRRHGRRGRSQRAMARASA